MNTNNLYPIHGEFVTKRGTKVAYQEWADGITLVNCLVVDAYWKKGGRTVFDTFRDMKTCLDNDL
jgi:hypothetical protein